MKIVDIAEFYSDQGGGVKTYILQKLEHAARLGVSVDIVAPGAENATRHVSSGRIIWVKSPVHPVDRRYYAFARAAPVHEVIDSVRPDVVEGSSPWRGGWIAGSWRGSALRSHFIHSDPVASYPHTYLGRRIGYDRTDKLFSWFWAYLRRLDRLFDMSVVSSPWLAQRMASFGLRKPVSIPFGINKSEFSDRYRCARTRREMLDRCGIAEDGAVLLITISRHHPEKRIPTMIQAVGEINRTRPIGLFVIGDGMSRRSIERSAARYRGIFIAGQILDRPQVARYLASSDAIIHGCSSETFGLVIAEGLSSGLPVIVPNRGGAADLAQPGFSETYEPGDVEDCKRAITAFMARDRSAMSEQAKAYASARIRNVSEHFEELFATYEARLVTPQKQGLGTG
ncbi:MAG: glycosyltransferase [Arenicellales bacterium]|jgi:alpha-1,6-mannosyltransferase